MTPKEFECTQCGKIIRVPKAITASVVKCPGCGADQRVPKRPAGRGGAQETTLTCPDCARTFSVPRPESGDVVSCPSCSSWVKVGPKRHPILYREVPMPFQYASSILRWLRFLAGFALLAGVAAAIWVGAFYSTRAAEDGSGRVLNPTGVLGALAALVIGLSGAVVMMALYWILQNVNAIHYATRQRRQKE